MTTKLRSLIDNWEAVNAGEDPSVPWYREGEKQRLAYQTPEWARLMAASQKHQIPVWLLHEAAKHLVHVRGCQLLEAFERLAFNLEAMDDPMWAWRRGLQLDNKARLDAGLL